MRFSDPSFEWNMAQPKVGIWLESRKTRWSEDYLMHVILTPKGIEEVAAKENDNIFEVLS